MSGAEVCPRDGWRLVVVEHPEDRARLVGNCTHPACGAWWEVTGR